MRMRQCNISTWIIRKIIPVCIINNTPYPCENSRTSWFWRLQKLTKSSMLDIGLLIIFDDFWYQEFTRFSRTRCVWKHAIFRLELSMRLYPFVLETIRHTLVNIPVNRNFETFENWQNPLCLTYDFWSFLTIFDVKSLRDFHELDAYEKTQYFDLNYPWDCSRVY